MHQTMVYFDIAYLSELIIADNLILLNISQENDSKNDSQDKSEDTK